MDVHKVAVFTTKSEMDSEVSHSSQSVEYDYFQVSDKGRLPNRLQAKIPKMFGWQLKPGYDYYLWVDGNISLNKPNALEYLISEIQGHEFLGIRHHRRPDIRQEVRYLRKGLREQSKYLVSRYDNELWQEQYDEICANKTFQDDLLLIGGIFLYRDTENIRKAMKDWWYHVSRYNVQDQISLPYVLKTNNVSVKVLDHDYTQWELIRHERHRRRNT